MAEQDNVRFHVSPDLDYQYRDVVNIFVGASDVVLEFGNRHRSMPEHATISNRLVLSIPNAYDFLQRLQQTLQDAQAKLQKTLSEKKG